MSESWAIAVVSMLAANVMALVAFLMRASNLAGRIEERVDRLTQLVDLHRGERVTSVAELHRRIDALESQLHKLKEQVVALESKGGCKWES